MNEKDRLDVASEQLNRVLGFFGRVDSKASALFATNSALLAIVCLNLSGSDIYVWYLTASAALAISLILVSHYFLYRCAFPSLKGGNNSLIYFREIANRTEAKFIDEFVSADEDELTKDVLGQVWRNAEILKIKFDSVKVSFILTAISLLPWAAFLIGSALKHGQAPSLR